MANLGITLILITLGISTLTLIILIVTCIARKYKLSDKNKERCLKLKQKFFFNPLLRFTYLNTLKWSMLSFVAFTTLKGSDSSVAIGVVIFIVIVALPFFFAEVLHKNKDNLNEENMKKTIGTLYDGLRVSSVRDTKNVWWYPVVFMLRRVLFIVITVAMFDYPTLQMAAHQVLTLLYIKYLCTDNLFESKRRQRVEVASEFICMIACIFLQ